MMYTFHNVVHCWRPHSSEPFKHN